MANKIDEVNAQVIYDSLFMSEPEFGLVYGELYPSYTLSELKEMFHRIRDRIIEEGIPYNRHLKKTRLSTGSFGDIRVAQGSSRRSEERPVKKVEEVADVPLRAERKGSLKDEIIALHEEGKSKSQIRDAVGCKYQYVFQTVKKYEEAQKVDS